MCIDGEIPTFPAPEPAPNPKKWSPSLYSVKEEHKNDLRLIKRLDDEGIRKTNRRIRDRYRKLEDKLSRVCQASGNGLYRFQVLTNSAQNDGGANRSVTNNKHQLINFQPIQPYPVSGVAEGQPAIHCTGKGLLPWKSDNGDTIMVKCFYCPNVSNTIISPTDIVQDNRDKYTGWIMHADVERGMGTCKFIAKDGVTHTTYSAYMENNLWYHYLETNPSNTEHAVVRQLTDTAEHELWHHRLGHPGKTVTSIIHDYVDGVPKLRANQFYCCAACMSGKFNKSHIGDNKQGLKSIVKQLPKELQDKVKTTTKNDTLLPKDQYSVGQHLHMDFGFVRGSDWSKKDNDGKLVTSVDYYRSYLLIIDRASRYIWIYLRRTKEPPINLAEGLLTLWKNKYKDASITTDQGTELGRSKEFQKMCKRMGYALKTTGSDSSAQNGLAEKPNQDLAKIMRCLLYSAGLGSEYWSYALRHAVYLKNRLPHRANKWETPYTVVNGKKPDLSRLRIFGSKVQIKQSNKRQKKLDKISKEGLFMTYKGTDKIVYVVNKQGKQEKTATHVTFDEAHMSSSLQTQPPMSSALQQAGYRTKPYEESLSGATDITYTVKFKKLSKKATEPHKASDGAAGLDFYSAENVIIHPHQQTRVHTDLALEIPENHYGQLKVRSGAASKNSISVEAGVIDSDYRGEVEFLIRNNGQEPYTINAGDKIGQMIILQLPTLQLEETKTLSSTVRGTKGFGSTDTPASNTAPKTQPIPPLTYIAQSKHHDPNARRYCTRPATGIEWKDITRRVTINNTTGETIQDIPIEPSTDKTTLQQRLPVGINDITTIFYYITSKPLTISPPTQPAAQHLISNKNTTAAAARLTDHAHDELHLPHCNVELSCDPFMDSENITIQVRGQHPTQGLMLRDSALWDERVQIEGCHLGTASRRVPKWIQRLKGGLLITVNGINITSTKQATQLISKAVNNKEENIYIRVSPEERAAIHHDEGVPMLYFDQLVTIAEHLHDIKHDQTSSTEPTMSKLYRSKQPQDAYLKNMIDTYKKHGTIKALKSILPKNKRRTKRLTRKILKARDDWDEWQASEYKQLDDYCNQRTFGEPCPLPIGANVLDLLWTYTQKDAVGENMPSRKKSRCVCNGKPSNKNTVIFGHTFTKMLDHMSSRLFWAIVASLNYIVRGADASNAFAEAAPPKIPLYVRVDKPYREWYKARYNKDIPDGYVLPVHRALQGHPEAPRSWGKLIDRIIRTKIKLRPTTHEPCLYSGTFNGKNVLFLRQVDDFAVAAEDNSTCQAVITAINDELSIEIKDLGQLTRYNGVDVIQSRDYIKLANETYVEKVLEEHSWLLKDLPISNRPIPMNSDKAYSRILESAKGPESLSEQRKLQLDMGFNYRQVVGELIYLMVTCRPDISFPLIKLSQYNTNPAKEHYEGLKHLLKFVEATKSEGLYYWRQKPRDDLPKLPLPTTTQNNYTNDSMEYVDHPTNLHGAVDSDWGGDTTHRKSVTGIIIRIAGGTVVYKTKYQDVVALSSTEAEFTAACDASRSILYVRSILDEIGVQQDQATPLFVDNNGALLMGNAQQPTRRTRHMDMKKFVLQDWIERDIIILKRIQSKNNYSDSMTKPVPRDLYTRHNEYIMGKYIPKYSYLFELQNAVVNLLHSGIEGLYCLV